MTPGQYRRQLDGIMQRLLVTIVPVLRVLFRSGLEDEGVRRRRTNIAVSTVLTEVRLARKAVESLTRKFMRAQALEQNDVDDPYVPPLAGYSEQAVRKSIDTLIERHVSEGRRRDVSVADASAVFVRHAEQAGRQMVIDAVEPEDEDDDETVEDRARDPERPREPDPTADEPAEPAEPEPADNVVPERELEKRREARDKRRPVAYARVLQGEYNCAFCVMLASRGAVYKSKKYAKYKEFGEPREKYHDKCDCIVVPVYTSAAWDGKAEADALYKLWLEATEGFKQQDAINALRRDLYRRARDGVPLYDGYRVREPVKEKKAA